MPELPEVETIRMQLEKLIIGKTISSIKVLNQKSYKKNPDPLLSQDFLYVHFNNDLLKRG